MSVGGDSCDSSKGLLSWAEYYDFDLGWRRHLGNVLCHLPMLLAIWRMRPRRVLEVGTGTASLAIFLSYLGYQVVSVDIVPGILRRAIRNRSRLHGQVHFVLADAFNLPVFPGRRFDVAISQGFFEHFEDADICRLLHEQLRVARRVVFSVPNQAYGRRDRGDERLLTADEWEKILARGGFRIQSSRQYRPINRGTFTGYAWRRPPTMYMAVVSANG